jgi:hypothetical protein
MAETSYKMEEIIEKLIDWINAVYLQLLKRDLENWKMKAILNGADANKIANIDIDYPDGKEKEMATLDELARFGLVDTRFKGQRAGKKNG